MPVFRQTRVSIVFMIKNIAFIQSFWLFFPSSNKLFTHFCPVVSLVYIKLTTNMPKLQSQKPCNVSSVIYPAVQSHSVTLLSFIQLGPFYKLLENKYGHSKLPVQFIYSHHNISDVASTLLFISVVIQKLP